VKKEIDCQFFEDQLDALSQGKLSGEGMDQLRLHAGSCPDCAMRLKVKEHLALPSLRKMEAEVPQEYLDSIWSRVRDEVSTGRLVGARRIGPVRHFPWLVPGMAASIVALLFSTGFLFSELQQLKSGGQLLTQEVFQQRNQLAELSQISGSPLGLAGLANRYGLNRELLGNESLTVEEVTGVLRGRRGSQRLCTAAQLSAFLEDASPETPPEWEAALASLDGDDWVTARALLSVLESVETNPNLTFPSSRFIELLGSNARSTES
jgi:hypothetical protein